MVLLRVLEVQDPSHPRLRPAARLFHRHRDAVADEEILLLVDLHQGGGGEIALQRLLRLGDLGLGDPGVQLFERRLEIPGQEDLVIVPAAEGAVFAQDLLVIGKLHLPPQLVPQEVAGAALDEDVFGVVVGHMNTPLKAKQSKK